MEFLPVILFLAGSVLTEPQSEGVVTPSCCRQIFLSSSGSLAATQSGAMGIYTLNSQKIAGNPRPIYLKSEPSQDYYLYYSTKEGGPRGWVVGPQLLEDIYYLTTQQEGSSCPGGVYGAFDTSYSRDDTFAMECHSDQVKVPCCSGVLLTASGVVATNHGGILGLYNRVEDYNGHTAYQGGHINSSLFYRKAGHGPDGWMIGAELDQHSYMVTTRNKDFCPDQVMTGFDKDKEEDPSFRVDCRVKDLEIPSQDPGLPVTPLQVEPLHNRKTISSSARETLINSICFRLICIIYLAVERFT